MHQFGKNIAKSHGEPKSSRALFDQEPFLKKNLAEKMRQESMLLVYSFIAPIEIRSGEWATQASAIQYCKDNNFAFPKDSYQKNGPNMIKMLATANDLVTRLNDQVFDLTSISNNSSLISTNTPVDMAKYHQLMETIADTVDKVELYVKNPQRLLED